MLGHGRSRAARTAEGFYGWRILAFCIVLQGLTGPGQTAGVSVFIDPMIAGLDVTRPQISGAYMVGTLAGAFGLPFLGRYLDAHGPRHTATVVGLAFGAVLVAMSGIVGVVTLTLGFVGIRMLGQGGLSLVATTTPARWFDRRRGFVIGITSAVGAAVNSLLPVLTAAVILLIGWRVTWVALGIVIWLVVLPIARWGLVDRPADLGQHMDGPAAAAARAAGQSRAARVQTVSATLEEALRTPIFWVLTTATMTIGLISTGLMFHQIDVLGERGLSPLEGAVNFVPQMVAALSATLGIGAMIDGFRQRYILVGGMALLAVSMIGLLSVRPGLTAIAYGLVFGAAMGWMRAAENASYPKLFGVDHVGKIRGVAKGFTVAGTACGPFTLSLGHSVTGSYRMIVLALLVLPLAVITAALVLPDRPGTRDGRR